MSLGSSISRLRAEKHLSQEDLAEALKVSRQSVSKWETDSSVPDLDKLVKLSQLFGVTLDELVMGPVPKPAQKKLSAGYTPMATLLGRRLSVKNVAGIVLLLAWLAVLLYDLQEGVLLWWALLNSLPLLLCGLLCLFLRRHTVFLCCWVLYLHMDWFFRSRSWINWKVVFRTVGYEPTENYLHLAFAWAQLLGMLVMLSWTLTVFRRGPVPAAFQKRGCLPICWAVYWIAGISAFWRQGDRTDWYGYSYPFRDIYVDWPLLLCFTALAALTVRMFLNRRTQGF